MSWLISQATCSGIKPSAGLGWLANMLLVGTIALKLLPQEELTAEPFIFHLITVCVFLNRNQILFQVWESVEKISSAS